MQQLHKDNHYVPQVYLRQWAVNEKVPTYSLLVRHENVPHWKRHSLRGIAFHQHLYTRIVGGVASDDLERWLDSEFEGPAQNAIAKVVNDRPLASQDWEDLIRFAFAQDVRTPAKLRDFLRRQSEQMQPMIEKALNDAVIKLQSDEFSVKSGETNSSNDFPLKLTVNDSGDGTGTIKAETVIGRAMWHWSLRHLLTSTVSKIPKKGWSIVKAALGYSWPTSDDPLIRLNYWDSTHYNFEGGWDVPNGDILLPLSPTHILYRCNGNRSLARGHQFDAETSGKIRRLIIEHADRYVFAKDEFSIEGIRERTVSAKLFDAEKKTWANWHVEQTHVELGY